MSMNAPSSRILVAVFLLAVLVTAGLSVSNLTTSLQFSSRVSSSIDEYIVGPAQKTIILSSMREAIGYGGATDHFKNFVLRQDRFGIMETQWDLMMLRVNITAYRNIGTNEVEDAALRTIEETFNVYADAIAVAEVLAVAGAGADEIDAVVQVNDGPALEAFHQLDAVLDQSRLAAQEQTQQATMALSSAALRSAVASILITFVLLGAFFVMLKQREANTRLEDANSAKSDFLASMSHEIRTPMNGVLGMAELVLMSDLPKDTRENVEIIQESGQNLLGILNDILDLSKIEAGKVELELKEVDVASAVTSVASVIKSEIEKKGLWYKQTMPAELLCPVLMADGMRLRQVLTNLIGNAQKFTHKGGIELVLSQVQLENGKIETRFEIVDTGIGLSEEQQSRIFQPFSQADQSTTREYGGTGLGLSIARQLVELMGGEIGVTSARGEGSTFWFTIVSKAVKVRPCVPAVEEVAHPILFERGNNKIPHVLVAEDNKTNQILVTKMLGSLGFEILIVGDGRQAVEAVDRWSFDLILMDINLPVMDGMEAARQIKAKSGPSSQIPIIALTANTMKGDEEKYLAAGMDAYLAKPYNADQLLEVMDQQMKNHRSRRPARDEQHKKSA